MRKSHPLSLVRCEDGQGIVEFALIFPVMLVLVMGIIEFALLIMAHQIVQYSAFAAARSYAVYKGNSNADSYAKRAAAIACIPVSPTGTSVLSSVFPELGDFSLASVLGNFGQMIDRGACSYALTSVDITTSQIGDIGDVEYFEVKAKVTHWYDLKFPLVNVLAEFVNGNFFMQGGGSPPGVGDIGVIHGEESGIESEALWFATGIKFIKISHDCTMGSEWPNE